MRKIFSIILFCCIAFNGHAQNFNEWFKQKKTQKKYLLQQILAYQLYLGYLKKGYNIVQRGNGIIGTLKQEDRDQHKDKFERLKKASPAIRNNPKVAAILRLQEAILPIIQKTGGQIETAIVLNAGERTYIKKVFQNLLDQCKENMNQLAFLITDGQVQLSDDERMQRIDALYADMQVKYTFVYSFSKESGILRLARSREAATLGNRTLIHQQH
jgi:hypothetical protein